MKSKNHVIKFLLSIVAIGAPFCPTPATATIGGFTRKDSAPRFIKPSKKTCNGIKVKLISDSPQFILTPYSPLHLTPAEALLTFPNGKTIKEMGLFAGWGNASGFESKNIDMWQHTGGYSVYYKEKRICYFDKHEEREKLRKKEKTITPTSKQV